MAILTRQTGGGSAQRLRTAFEKAGHRVDMLNTLDLTLSLDIGAVTLHNGKQPLPYHDAILARVGAGITTHGVAVLRHFELNEVPTLPTSGALLRSRNKFEALQHLSAAGLPIPQTIYLHRLEDVDDVIHRMRSAPLIVKVLEGSGGRGVVLAQSAQTASAMACALIQAGRPVLLQRFIAESYGQDTRVFVVGNRVVAAVQRKARPGEFRSNVHLGAKATRIEIDDETHDVAVSAAKCLGLEIAGVDILHGQNGPLVLEVNSSPGILGFEQSTGADVATTIVRHVEHRIFG